MYSGNIPRSVGCLRLRLRAQIPDFAPPVLQQVPVFGQFQLTSDANPGRLVPGRFACVLSVDEDSLTPMHTPQPAEFAGSE
jgi:hypothetical protein